MGRQISAGDFAPTILHVRARASEDGKAGGGARHARNNRGNRLRLRMRLTTLFAGTVLMSDTQRPPAKVFRIEAAASANRYLRGNTRKMKVVPPPPTARARDVGFILLRLDPACSALL